MQERFNKYLLPFLYSNNSIPKAIMCFASDVDRNSDSKELQERANALLNYRDYITDKQLIYRLRDVTQKWVEAIRGDNTFKSIRFTLTGRRKSLYSVDDKITDHEAKGKPISINDILGIRIVIHCLTPDEFIDELSKISIMTIDKFRSYGFIPVPAKPLKDTEDFKKEDFPNLYVPSEPILPTSYRLYAKDYIFNPKRNGYQSLQGVMFDPETNKTFEWQIRTNFMNVNAYYQSASHQKFKDDRRLNRVINNNDSLEEEEIDISKIHMYGFDITGNSEYPYIDNVGILQPQDFLQHQRISSMGAEV